MAAQAKSPNGFHWNPALIKWCIYLCKKVHEPTNFLKKLKFYIYLHTVLCVNTAMILIPPLGFSNELDEQLFCDAKVSSLQEIQKYVGLVGDEMYIKEGLVLR